jgi:pilus assembly protein Flp/PilA
MAFTLLYIRSWLSSATVRNDDRGASLVEYALLLVMIAVVCVVAVGFLGTSTSGGVNESGSSMFVP